MFFCFYAANFQVHESVTDDFFSSRDSIFCTDLAVCFRCNKINTSIKFLNAHKSRSKLQVISNYEYIRTLADHLCLPILRSHSKARLCRVGMFIASLHLPIPKHFAIPLPSSLDREISYLTLQCQLHQRSRHYHAIGPNQIHLQPPQFQSLALSFSNSP